jgi:hypothetical protein
MFWLAFAAIGLNRLTETIFFRVTGGFGNNIDISSYTSYLKAETGVFQN